MSCYCRLQPYSVASNSHFQNELSKLTQHESSITQLINMAKNLIKESPELDVLVQEPMFRLEVEWKRLYNLMQACNTQLKIYEDNLPFYRILNTINKNNADINELLQNPNKVRIYQYERGLQVFYAVLYLLRLIGAVNKYETLYLFTISKY